jgi:hypothetical protein
VKTHALSFARPSRPRLAGRANLQVVEKLYESQGNTNVMKVTAQAPQLACTGRVDGSGYQNFRQQLQSLVLEMQIGVALRGVVG